ncbi:MAG: hypothetical protein M5U09_19915 [Gammaproteobacteria bacterium]|nr:hypothetical protein [Gammaproteobacteria bacterium]
MPSYIPPPSGFVDEQQQGRSGEVHSCRLLTSRIAKIAYKTREHSTFSSAGISVDSFFCGDRVERPFPSAVRYLVDISSRDSSEVCPERLSMAILADPVNTEVRDLMRYQGVNIDTSRSGINNQYCRRLIRWCVVSAGVANIDIAKIIASARSSYRGNPDPRRLRSEERPVLWMRYESAYVLGKLARRSAAT